jgi:HTH-type transcriptional regulator / antitoxin HigA
MASRKTLTAAAHVPDVYLDLIRCFPLRPIRSDVELDQAIAMMNTLLDRAALDPAEQDYLDVLGDLVERYEHQAHPIPDVGDGDMLRFLMDQKGVKVVNLVRGAGIAPATLAEVLAGKRQLNRAQISKLARYFQVAPAVFLPAKAEPSS